MSKQKVTLRIEEGEVELLKEKFKTDNQSEAIRLVILQSLVTEDLEKVKTLFPYIGKKPTRIGREVVNAFEQSGCRIFIDLFCGSLAMLCYLGTKIKDCPTISLRGFQQKNPFICIHIMNYRFH